MTDYERLLLRFKRSTSLPPLPGTAVQLIKAIDSGEASAASLEKIINADPALAADILRVAGTEGRTTTPRMAIMRLGQRAVRSLAVSMTVQAIISEGSDQEFDGTAFARHCAFVGFVSRYLSVRIRRSAEFQTAWAPDEFFAAGLLHELGTALLAKVEPRVYRAVAGHARNEGISVPAAFERMFKQSLSSLGKAAAEVWGLPALFVHVADYIERPFEADSERHALMTLAYADGLAESNGLTVEDWEMSPPDLSLLEAEIGLAPEEIETMVTIVSDQVLAFIPAKLKAA